MFGKWILDLKTKYYELITRNDVPSPKSEWALDWDKMIHLDAEELAEQGLATFYDFIQPELSKFIAAPNPLTEIRDENDFYYVESGGYVWPIVDETSMTSGNVWLNAAFAFF